MQNCYVCGGNLKTFLPEARDVQTGDKFSLLVCEKCGFGETRAQPADLAPYYAEYHGKRHGFTTDYCAWRRARWLKKSFRGGEENGKSEKKLLDIGCGDGSFLETAKKRGWTAVGTELNTEKFRDSEFVVYKDLDEVAEKHAPESFDAVTMWHTLEHFKSPREIVSKAEKMLAPDGVLLIAVPDYGGFQAQIFRQNWLHLDVPRHLFHFNFTSLDALLKQCGFRVEWQRNQEFEYDLMGWSQSALNAVFQKKNVFFKALAGQTNGVGAGELAINYVFGAAFSVIALSVVPLSALLKKGGTLVVGARKIN